jgi:hypothetical protein
MPKPKEEETAPVAEEKEVVETPPPETTTPAPEPEAKTEPEVTPTAVEEGRAAGEQAQQPAPTLAGVRDYLKTQGLDVSSYKDDATVVTALLSAAQQAREYRDAAQRYMQVAPQFEEFQRQQAASLQQRQQQQDESKKTVFDKQPQWDPRWATMVERDPVSGILKEKPGAPAGTAAKVQAYAQWVDEVEWLRQNDPRSYAKQVTQGEVERLVEERMGQFNEQNFARDFERQHQQWLYQRDQAGNPLVDPRTGQTRLTPAANAFARHAIEAQQLGIRGIQQQYAYAQRMLVADVAEQGLLKQPAAGNVATPAADANAQKKDELLRKNGAQPRQPNRNGAAKGGDGASEVDRSGRGLKFGERLAKAWVDKGDDYFAAGGEVED